MELGLILWLIMEENRFLWRLSVEELSNLESQNSPSLLRDSSINTSLKKPW